MYGFSSLVLFGAFFCAVLTAGAAAFACRPVSGPSSSGRNQTQVPFPPLRPASRSFLLVAELMQWLVLLLLTLASAVLVHAFINHDFSLDYVVRYSDRTLPSFYLVTAFWAGQSGSMLFWAWAVSLSGAVFSLTPGYRRLTIETRLLFWVFFLCIISFFLLLLTTWNDPFEPWTDRSGMPAPPPDDGFGLNPMLQNPGMILHPPLLFLGYGGFVVPGCLALAQHIAGGFGSRLRSGVIEAFEEAAWGQAARPFILAAWLLLTAGIILGAWWAYMELGWGGYWAWDPVENASLIPWLAATAYLHTALIESRRGKLRRINCFLMALTTISAFFATYLVRSGIIQSLHAFGTGSVGQPLLIFILASLYLVFIISLASQVRPGKSLGSLSSREGLLVLVAWIMLALSLIILLATLWPVIANFLQSLIPLVPMSVAVTLNDLPTGLDTGFYNRVCLPLFAALSCLLAVCPYRKWNTIPVRPTLRGVFSLAGIGAALALPLLARRLDAVFQQTGQYALPEFIQNGCLALSAHAGLLFTGCFILGLFPSTRRTGVLFPNVFRFVLAAAGLLALYLYRLGVHEPVALVAASFSLAASAGLVGIFAATPRMLRDKPLLAAHGVHIGLLLVILGVSFSGPYQVEYTLQLEQGRAVRAGDYTFALQRIFQGHSSPRDTSEANYEYLQADILVSRNGAVSGLLTPQRRLYAKYEKQSFTEVSTLFSLGNEVYATLFNVEGNRATVLIHVNPLVNWLWIGGTLMCLFPLLGLWSSRARKRRPDQNMHAEPETALPPAGSEAAGKPC